MMCSAACFFGLVLGELQEIYAAANVKVFVKLQMCRYNFFYGYLEIEDCVLHPCPETTIATES